MSRYRRRDRSGGDRNHYSGYLTWLQNHHEAFKPLHPDQVTAMGSQERLNYDEQRHAYLSRGITVMSRTVRNLDDTVDQLMDQNHARRGGGCGAFLSAPSGYGKTTAIHTVLGSVLGVILKKEPTCLQSGQIPVAYIAIPASGTQKSIYQAIADYLGIPYTAGTYEPELATMVRNGINRSQIDLLAIDEVQNLDNADRAESAADALRRLGDEVDATLILAGIDLEHSTITLGSRGAQIANRYTRAAVFDYSDKKIADYQSAWMALVGGMIEALPLYATDATDVPVLAPYLREMTGGSVGMLNSALTQVARTLIQTGDLQNEKITIDRLRRVSRTLQAERHELSQQDVVDQGGAQQGTEAIAGRPGGQVREL